MWDARPHCSNKGSFTISVSGCQGRWKHFLSLQEMNKQEGSLLLRTSPDVTLMMDWLGKKQQIYRTVPNRVLRFCTGREKWMLLKKVEVAKELKKVFSMNKEIDDAHGRRKRSCECNVRCECNEGISGRRRKELMKRNYGISFRSGTTWLRVGLKTCERLRDRHAQKN